MDKFPEAFNRYEERVDIDDLQSASELISSFSIFQGYNATSKQIDGLRIESIKRRLGFDWSIPKWVKKKDYWRFPHKAIVTQNWKTTIQSGKHRGFSNKQMLEANLKPVIETLRQVALSRSLSSKCFLSICFLM